MGSHPNNHVRCDVTLAPALVKDDEFWYGGRWWVIQSPLGESGYVLAAELIDDAGGTNDTQKIDFSDDECVLVRKHEEEGHIFIHHKDGGWSKSDRVHSLVDAHFMAVGAAMAAPGCRVTWRAGHADEDVQIWPKP